MAAHLYRSVNVDVRQKRLTNVCKQFGVEGQHLLFHPRRTLYERKIKPQREYDAKHILLVHQMCTHPARKCGLRNSVSYVKYKQQLFSFYLVI